MTAIVARRCFVSGRVQGVFFRASARQKATELGISGYARNLPDGRVEVLVVGEAMAAQRLIEWLAVGPPTARVTDVAINEIDPSEAKDVPVGFGTK